MKRLSIYFSAGVGALFGALGLLGGVQAAPTTQPSSIPLGIALTPAIQDRALGPAEKAVSFSVQLSNQTAQPITFSISSADFTALNQTGGLTFLGSDARRVSSGHGLSGILKIDTPTITIPGTSTKAVTVHIDNVASLAPGGHYGAILARAVPSGKNATGNQVSINQVVSSLVFLETAGQGTKTLSLLPPAVSKLSFGLPSEQNLVFKATGNTQTVPRGVVSLVRGQTVMQQGIINENSSLILPGSTRLLQIPLHGNRHPWLPGKYTLRVQYRYDGSLGITTYEKQFLYINFAALVVMIVGGVVVLYGAFQSRRLWRHYEPSNLQTVSTKRTIAVRDNSHKSHTVTVSRGSKK